MITKNSEELLEKSLDSVRKLSGDLVIIDDYSTDNTLSIAKRFGARVFKRHDENLGRQRAFGLSRCRGKWVLMLDADEIISSQLYDEIKSKVESERLKVDGFNIPYQNHLLGRAIHYGGEGYKIMRLFRKSASSISDSLIHEHVLVEGAVGEMKGKIYHFSYRTVGQMFLKFTDYAKREARRKIASGERTNLRKIIFHPLHMFWARYVKDQGYRDCLPRLILDLGFAYMEWLTYMLMLFYKNKP